MVHVVATPLLGNIKSDYPLGFAFSISGNFQSTMDAEDSFIIPASSFDEDKPLILIDIPVCVKNEK